MQHGRYTEKLDVSAPRGPSCFSSVFCSEASKAVLNVMEFLKVKKKKESFLRGREMRQWDLIKERHCVFQIVHLFYFDFTILEVFC